MRTVISEASAPLRSSSFSSGRKSTLITAVLGRTTLPSSRSRRTFSGPTISALDRLRVLVTTAPRSRVSVPSSFFTCSQSFRSMKTA